VVVREKTLRFPSGFLWWGLLFIFGFYGFTGAGGITGLRGGRIFRSILAWLYILWMLSGAIEAC